MPTNSFYRESFSQESGQPFISLIRVNVDGDYYYYANDNVGHTSNVSGSSQFYQKAAFNLTLPENKTEGTPTAKLEFDAADIQIVRLLRQAEEKIVIDLWVVLADNVNVAEFGPANYESEKFTIKATAVSMELVSEPILDVQFPGYRFTPETFPSLWREQFGV